MRPKLLSSYLALTLLVLGLFAVFSFNLQNSYLLSSDFGRDIDQALKITQGHFTIVGPWLNFKGLLAGPYYYYFLSIPLFLTFANPNSILFVNALMFALSLGFFFLRIQKETTPQKSLLATLTLAFSYLFILTARTPGNGFSYIPLLLVVLTDFYTTKQYSFKHVTLLGILSGLLVNTHPISSFVLVPIFIYFLFKNRLQCLVLCLGLSITYLPLLLFELLHHFQIFKSFITPDYNQTNNLGNFSSHQSIFSVLKLNIQTILVFLSRQFVLPSILTISSIIIFSLVTFRKSQLFIVFHLLCSLLLFIVLLPKTAEFHYSLPFGLLILFLFTLLIVRSRLYLLLSLFIILEILFFPFNLFKSSPRNFYTIEKRVDFILALNIIDKEDSINVIKFSDSNSFLPIGQEYRFFLRRAGYKVDSEYEYPKSKQLVIFAEYPQFDITKFHTWETGQFGNEYLRNYKKYLFDETSIYIVKKF